MLDRPSRVDFVAGASEAPAIVVSQLVKAFGQTRVLDGVDLTVSAGHALALIGANGAGKSTLLRCLVRLTEPTSGRIQILGKDLTAVSGHELSRLRSRIGVVFQRHNLVPRLSALSNVIHGVQARERGPRTWSQTLARAPVRDEAMWCLERVGLANKAGQRADSLSGGQSQRVAIARMLMQRPEIVLADEPDASLDPRSGEDVMALLYQLSSDNRLPLVVISHRIEHTLRFSDRIVGLAGGRIVMDTPSCDVRPEDLRTFFVGVAA
ncbi:phosphonate ABC transporter ATP-binding protein [Leptospira interrogans]